ncbi:MAG TPA: LEPR-XLL domain-containing protein, partial [Phycisphaerae bacterium]|nr:LEPR-XLL domain-containing protein [Phycisphaerae bacterium]
MSDSSLQVPSMEQMEPRLLMSASPTLQELFSSAAEVDVVAAGTVSENGTVNEAENAAMYKFTAKASGYFYLDMKAADGSVVDSYLEVFNSGRRLIYRNDNVASGNPDSRTGFRVTAGQTFYVRASAARETEGDYELTFEGRPTDDLGNAAEAASPPRLGRDGSTWTHATVNYAGDSDFLAYTALDSGLVRLQMGRYGRYSRLSGALNVHDSEGNIIASEVSASNGALALSFTAVKGQTYYLEVSGQDDSTGAYWVRALPMILQEFIDAQEVDLPSFSTETLTGTFDADGTKMYKFTTTASGYIYLDMKAADGSEIDSYIEVFLPNQRSLKRNNNASRSTQDSRIWLRVKPGQTFYVRASSAGETAGDFELTFSNRPTDDFGNAAEVAAALRLRGNGSTAARGSVNCVGDTDYLAYTALDSGLVRVQ